LYVRYPVERCALDGDERELQTGTELDESVIIEIWCKRPVDVINVAMFSV
jgi:hypothetical protein